jgi:nucleoid-associated protein YgaU
MTVRIRSTSRLKFARLATIDGVEHWELPEYPRVDEAADDIKYVVDRSDRIDKLATTFYSDPSLWWIIALANGMALLPNDLDAGTTIRIPSQRRVFVEILRRPSSGAEGR